jgi:hypothetical protein
MDLLAEIQNRKRKLEEIGAVKDKKYVKKGDLEKERVKQYYEEQRKLEEKKNKKKEETKPAIEAPAPEEPKEEKVRRSDLHILFWPRTTIQDDTNSNYRPFKSHYLVKK